MNSGLQISVLIAMSSFHQIVCSIVVWLQRCSRLDIHHTCILIMATLELFECPSCFNVFLSHHHYNQHLCPGKKHSLIRRKFDNYKVFWAPVWMTLHVQYYMYSTCAFIFIKLLFENWIIASQKRQFPLNMLWIYLRERESHLLF